MGYSHKKSQKFSPLLFAEKKKKRATDRCYSRVQAKCRKSKKSKRKKKKSQMFIWSSEACESAAAMSLKGSFSTSITWHWHRRAKNSVLTTEKSAHREGVVAAPPTLLERRFASRAEDAKYRERSPWGKCERKRGWKSVFVYSSLHATYDFVLAVHAARCCCCFGLNLCRQRSEKSIN